MWQSPIGKQDVPHSVRQYYSFQSLCQTITIYSASVRQYYNLQCLCQTILQFTVPLSDNITIYRASVRQYYNLQRLWQTLTYLIVQLLCKVSDTFLHLIEFVYKWISTLCSSLVPEGTHDKCYKSMYHN